MSINYCPHGKENDDPDGCEHEWKYQGLVYRLSEYNMPGSGAREVIYSDRYYCARCLETKDKNSRVQGNSYGKTIEGSHPS